jgi:hypothetical protein
MGLKRTWRGCRRNVCSAFAIRRYLDMPTAKELAERVGFEPTVRIDRTTAFEF